ncbi:sigma-70 family RNA polymerase sigma factor [Crassaminicella thermophila]|uniref:Sigma-70 family RNA polymerase sigma factor n=1 Tax=Crassaminicella thermophila TaxID=2599308 RepID=A0A5C0SDY9_CRATE|nr:sigma-70 family RNA polymerase sigma factor [Crassaminicella thermophila]QEK12330.1 sigma-70 family RNA polymerase sigma factor [Crassaminicella thermophila]
MKEIEKILIKKSKQGDIESFETLIKEHQKLAFNIAYRMLGNIEDAKDATQDAFIKTYKSLNKFKGESGFSTWLYKIVTNTCLDVLRKRKSQKTYSYDHQIDTEDGKILRDLPDERNIPEIIVERREHQRNIQEAINCLSEHYKTVIVLRDIKGFSYEQISKILDCSEGTIKSRISRARKALKFEIEKNRELYDKNYVKI